ncbi:MFS transporter [Bosea sp. ASV33]|uniref:MFS transporter n=1 Tax=Bosea sp. ASV33 TaxID=2795106 RepID=UPI0018EC0D50|nr:MFS transporter [Bosea sp. ASV33]
MSVKLWLTILIASLDNGALAAGRLILPLVALGVGASGALVGVMSGLFTAVPMLFSVRFGRWVDRAGTLVPMLFASSLIAASCLFFVLVPNRFVLVPIAGLLGAGAVFAHVATARAVTGQSEPFERARNLGFLVTSYSLFQFLCPMIASLAFDHYGSATALVTISGLGVLTVAAVAGLPIHNYRNESNRRQADVSSGGGLELFRIPKLRRWILVSSVFSASQTIFPLIVSLHAVEIGLSASRAGLVLGAFALGTVVSRLSVGLVGRTVRAPVALTFALFAGATIYAAFPMAHGLPALLPLAALLGLPLGIGVPISLNLIYDAAPQHRLNEAVGLCMSVTNFFQMMVPLSLGFVASGFGVAAMTWLIALMLLAPISLTVTALVRGPTA